MEAFHQPDAEMVGIGQIAYGSRGHLLCLAVGSCVALGLINESNGHGAMAHIFLPRAKDSAAIIAGQEGKYANIAVAHMAKQLRANSQPDAPLRAWVAGGARMFSHGFQQTGADVGKLNVDAVVAELKKQNIPIVQMDVGGIHARNVRLDLAQRRVVVYSGLLPESELSDRTRSAAETVEAGKESRP